MLWKLIKAVALAIVVAIVVWLLAEVLIAVGSPLAVRVAGFLNNVNEIVGLLAGLWYFFFAGEQVTSWPNRKV